MVDRQLEDLRERLFKSAKNHPVFVKRDTDTIIKILYILDAIMDRLDVLEEKS